MSCEHCDPCAAGCGCDCDCTQACGSAPQLSPPANPAGRSALRTRIGSYGDFFADALRRLGSSDAPALRTLGTRDPDDPAIALLDAWAVAADVLTFYRERLSNEGYLRTANSERSLRELAAAVGFKPRPGVAATVHLAFLLDPNAAPVDIPAGAKAQTIPQPGEQMQTFETDEALQARAEWSAMAPRLARVPALDRVAALTRAEVRLADASLLVRPGEKLLFRFRDGYAQQIVREVAAARNDVQNGCVVLALKPRPGLTPDLAKKIVQLGDDLAHKLEQADASDRPALLALLEPLVSYLLGASALDALGGANVPGAVNNDSPLSEILKELLVPPPDTRIDVQAVNIDGSLGALQRAPVAQPPAARYLPRAAVAGLGASGITRGALLQSLTPGLDRNLYAAWRNLPATPATRDNAPDLYLLRATASPYGATAPLRASLVKDTQGDWDLEAVDTIFAFLDNVNEAVDPSSFALVQTPSLDSIGAHTIRFARVIGAGTVQRGDYGVNSKVSRLELADPVSGALLPVVQGSFGKEGSPPLAYLRNTVFAVQSEPVALAPEAIPDDVGGATITLAGLYDGLAVGRWLIVAGERTDVQANGMPVPGIRDGELAMVAAIGQAPDGDAAGDSRHTVVVLRDALAFTYRRASVTVYGNVVKASHGETVTEVLGSGDAQARFATYDLKRPPLTFVPAPTPAGVAGSQTVRVNDVRWHEVDALLDAGPADRAYAMSVDGSGAATIVFGDGRHGARLPTGQDNVRAQYRVGIGRAGNVLAGQVTLLSTRPLGVQGVVNPLRASGGAEADRMEQIRRNLPQGVLALAPASRLVSVQDYAYFAQRFAAIGHVQATRLADGGSSVVYLTLAGVDDIPLDPDGALLASLTSALRTYGDPLLPVVLGVRELIALVLQARVAIDADADWNVVEPALRARVLDAFSFDRAQLGRPVYLSQAIAAMQDTPGVAWVDVDVFGGIAEWQLRDQEALKVAVDALLAQTAGGPVPDAVTCLPARPNDAPSLSTSGLLEPDTPRFLPAQLAMLAPGVPDTLVFNLVDTRSTPC